MSLAFTCLGLTLRVVQEKQPNIPKRGQRLERTLELFCSSSPRPFVKPFHFSVSAPGKTACSDRNL